MKVKDKIAMKKSYSLLKRRRGKFELARVGAGKEFVHRAVIGTREGK